MTSVNHNPIPLRAATQLDRTHVDPEGCGFLAISACAYYVRIAHVLNGELIDCLDVAPKQTERVLRFVRLTRRYFPAATLVGERRDCWPNGLQATLVQEFGPVHWVSDVLIKRTASEYRRCTKVLKFTRPSFLAACMAHDVHHAALYPDTLLASWKKALLTDIVITLDLGPPPEIPF